MLSYRQKIQVDSPRGKVKMDRFDLYADLPPLLPVEDQVKPPAMTSRVISTLQKYPYMVGRRASSAGGGKSSSNDTWLLNRSKSLAETRQPRHMLESTPPSLEGQMPKRKANDCLEVIPQNTVPMAKYRKNFVRKKLMKHAAEMEGTITDEDLWKRRKTQEEQARIASFKRRQAGDESGKLEWAATAEGFGQNEAKKTLEEEIYKPTYVADADLDEETFFRALGKSIPRKKIAVVSAVMQKIEKRKQEKEERKVNERMMMEINSPGAGADGRQSGGTEGVVESLGADSAERKDDKEKLPETSSEKNNKIQVANEETKAKEVVSKAVSISSPNADASSATNHDEAPRRRDDVIDVVTSRDDKPPDPITQPPKSKSRRPVARNASLLRRTGLAKSEGDLQAALSGMRTPAFPAPPDTFCDTRTMISYSEILMASARNLTRTVSMIDVEPPGARDIYPLTYIPQLSHVATSTSVADDEMFILPPEIFPSAGSEASLSRAKSLGHLSHRLTGSREPLYAKSLAKSRSALHVRTPSSTARSRTRRSLDPLEARRSRRHQDAQFLHRIASIVEKQNELLDRWQATDKTPKKPKSSILRRRSKSLYDIREKYRRPPEQQPAPFGDRPVTSHGVYGDDVTARSSADPYSSSIESDEVYGGLETKFDDITDGALAQARQRSSGNASSQALADENAISKVYATENALNPVYSTENASNATENESNQIYGDKNEPEEQQLDSGVHSKSIKPTKPPRHSIELARSRSKTPNARAVSAGPNPQSRDFILDGIKEDTPRPIPASRTPRPPSSAARRPLSRSETMGKELAKDASQVIKIDIIESRDERVDSRAESRMSRAESRTSRAAGSRMSTRTPEDGLKRRRSLIRVKGISTRRGESAEALKSKIQSVVDAGTGMGGDEDGWWVLWSRQEGAKKSGLLSRFHSKIGKGGLGKPKDLSIVAEVVQKLPGETVYDDIVAANGGDATVAGHQEDIYAVAIKQKHRVRTSLTGDSQKKKKKRRKKSDAPSQESYRSLLDAPEYSCEDEVSDVAPLPSEDWKSVRASVPASVYASVSVPTSTRGSVASSSRSKAASIAAFSASIASVSAPVESVSASVSPVSASVTSVSRSVASVSRSVPASAVREPSFDSGISTQPTDDEQRDVSPKPRDRQSLGRDAGSASTSADTSMSREEKSRLINDEHKDNADSGAEGSSGNREESFMKKVANFFGVSYEEDPDELPLNNIFQKRGILASG